MADDLMEQLAAEAAEQLPVPTDEGMARARRAAQEMVNLESEVESLEEQLKARKVRLWDVKTKELPDLFGELGIDSLGLQEVELDLVIVPYYKANISADWPEEQREAAFQYLEEIGGGDIVNNTVTVVFPKGHYDELREWMERVQGLNFEFDPPEMVEAKMVPWNTLTAFVKEQVQKGTVLELDKLGATVATIAKIKKRK